MSDENKLTNEQIEEAALRSAANMGLPKDIFHPDYGWILKDGKLTEVGLVWAKETNYVGSFNNG